MGAPPQRGKEWETKAMLMNRKETSTLPLPEALFKEAVGLLGCQGRAARARHRGCRRTARYSLCDCPEPAGTAVPERRTGAERGRAPTLPG